MAEERRWHPIIMSGESVRATQAGRKTVTRRVIRPQPVGSPWFDEEAGYWSDYLGDRWEWVPDGHGYRHEPTEELTRPLTRGYRPGDMLWTREAWAARERFDAYRPSEIPEGAYIHYRADHPGDSHIMGMGRGRWRSPIHMPRWAFRLSLEVVDERAERLQDITDEDAVREGVPAPDPLAVTQYSPRDLFAVEWDRLNARRGYSWESNLWVWRIEYRYPPNGTGPEGET